MLSQPLKNMLLLSNSLCVFTPIVFFTAYFVQLLSVCCMLLCRVVCLCGQETWTVFLSKYYLCYYWKPAYTHTQTQPESKSLHFATLVLYN